MIKILDIVKIRQKYNVLLSDETSLNVTEKFIIDNKIYINKEFSLDEFEEILKSVDFYNYLEIAINYINKYYKNSYIIEQYLIKKGASKDLAKNVVLYLIEHKLVDDLKYLNDFINHYLELSYGPKYIISKAYSINIEQNLIRSIDFNLYQDRIYDNLVHLIDKLNLSIKEQDKYKKRNKIIKSLLNKGYDYDMIISNLKEDL